MCHPSKYHASHYQIFMGILGRKLPTNSCNETVLKQGQVNSYVLVAFHLLRLDMSCVECSAQMSLNLPARSGNCHETCSSAAQCGTGAACAQWAVCPTAGRGTFEPFCSENPHREQDLWLRLKARDTERPFPALGIFYGFVTLFGLCEGMEVTIWCILFQ